MGESENKTCFKIANNVKCKLKQVLYAEKTVDHQKVIQNQRKKGKKTKNKKQETKPKNVSGKK